MKVSALSFRSAPTFGLVLISLAITLGLCLWIHEIRADVGAYNTVRIFLSLFLYQDYAAALLMAVVVMAAMFKPLQRYALAAVNIAGQRPEAVALIAFVMLATGAMVVYHAHPLSMDEYAAVFQARIFAEGRLYGVFPQELVDSLIMRNFQGYFLAVSHTSGEVASMYWPGFAVVLTPFTKLGAPWLANPLIGAATIYLAHRATLELTSNKDAAGMASLLTAASPALSINAISYYSMTAHLACNLVFMLLLLQPSVRRSFLAGLVGSLALVLHNPVPHILFALPWLIWLMTRRDRWRMLAAAAAGYLPLCILLGLGWPHVLAQLPTAAQSAVPGVIDSVDASVWVRRLQAIFRMPSLDVLEDRAMATAKLWLWAVPGLLILALVGLARERSDIRIRLMAWSAALTFFAYLFLPADQGHGWGYRYFHSVWFVLPLLAVLSIWPLASRSKDTFTRTHLSSPQSSLVGYVAACMLLSLLFMNGLRAVQVEDFVSRHLAQVPAVSSGTPEVVLINRRKGYYAPDLVQNDPFLRDRPIYLLSEVGKTDAELVARWFPGSVMLTSSETASVWGKP
jgi:hypothetical protein